MDLSQVTSTQWNQALLELQQSLGWAIILDNLDTLIAVVQDKINEMDPAITADEIWKLKVDLSKMKLLKEMPEELKVDTNKKQEAMIDETYS